MSATTQSETVNATDVNEGISQDIAFDVLSSRRRRHVLHYLSQQDRETTLRELSTRIAAWENETAPEDVTYQQRMRVYTALKQSHLPKMDDHGLVEFDADAATVELTDEASELEVYLDVVPHDEIPWSKYYLGLGVFCSGLVGIAAIGVFPFDLLPDLAWAAVVVALFTASAVAHVYYDEQMRIGGEGEPPL